MSLRPPVQPARTYTRTVTRPLMESWAFKALVKDPARGPVTLPSFARIAIVATNDEPGDTAVTIGSKRIRARNMNPGQRALVAEAVKGDVVTPHPGHDVQIEFYGEWRTIARG